MGFLPVIIAARQNPQPLHHPASVFPTERLRSRNSQPIPNLNTYLTLSKGVFGGTMIWVEVETFVKPFD